MTLRSDLRWVGVIALALLCGCAAIETRVGVSPIFGQSREQFALDIRQCQQQAQQASFFDPAVLPAHRDIEPQSLRVQVSCMTKIGYMMFLAYGQTLDQLEADKQVCVTAAMRAKSRLSDDDMKGIVGCMLGRGYFVAGPNFARSPK